MRSTSKRIANKGLELACFVAERLGSFPEDRTAGFAFSCEPSEGPDEGLDGGGGEGGGWDARGKGEVGVCRDRRFAWSGLFILCCAGLVW